jgi:ABC-type amino acid transport substrate-binding protein
MNTDQHRFYQNGESITVFSGRCMKKIIWILTIIMFSIPIFAEKLNMIVGVEEKTEGFRTAKRIVDAISERIGVTFTLISIPSGRANVLLESSHGGYDGELIVFEGRKIRNPDVIKVPEPFFQTSIVAVAMDKEIKIKGWASLKRYRLSHIRGWSVVEGPLKRLNLESRPLESTKSALQFLLAKRADLFLVTPLVVKKALHQPDFKDKGIIILKPPVGFVNFHTYFYKRRSDIARKYNEALKSMKQDGSYMKNVNATN